MSLQNILPRGCADGQNSRSHVPAVQPEPLPYLATSPFFSFETTTICSTPDLSGGSTLWSLPQLPCDIPGFLPITDAQQQPVLPTQGYGAMFPTHDTTAFEPLSITPTTMASTPTNSTSDKSERRKAQNRRSQRAYRARKEDQLKLGADRVEELTRELAEAKAANVRLWEVQRKLSLALQGPSSTASDADEQ